MLPFPYNSSATVTAHHLQMTSHLTQHLQVICRPNLYTDHLACSCLCVCNFSRNHLLIGLSRIRVPSQIPICPLSHSFPHNPKQPSCCSPSLLIRHPGFNVFSPDLPFSEIKLIIVENNLIPTIFFKGTETEVMEADERFRVEGLSQLGMRL